MEGYGDRVCVPRWTARVLGLFEDGVHVVADAVADAVPDFGDAADVDEALLWYA